MISRIGKSHRPGKGARAIPVRYLVLSALFLASAVNYADRAALGLVGPAVSSALDLTPVAMGYVLSASAISYFLAQVPGGMLLDRFGSRWVYTGAIALWSLFTMAQGWIGLLSAGAAVVVLLLVRLGFGLATAPGVPANARITASWFPASERGVATAIFNSSQYFALIAFAPLIGWVAHSLSWHWAFYGMGALGLAVAAIFPFVVRSPLRHPLIRPEELEYVQSRGALVNIETQHGARAFTLRNLKQVAFHRQLLGLYLFQYCLIVVATFFTTWFPIYLVQQKGFSLAQAAAATALSAFFGLAGNIAGGLMSDALLRRTGSLTFARKLPVIIGLLMAMLMLVCDFVNARDAVVIVMSIAFFGRGLAAMGWTMVSDVSPRELMGVTGGVFNMVSNLAAVVTPIAMGYIAAIFQSFDWAIVFVAVHCVIGIFVLAAMMGRIERIDLQPMSG